MEYLRLPNSDITVSRVGMGGCPMGGYGWGATDERELVDAVHAALDLGVTLFDTADTYGLGQSETTLGRALGSRRDEAVIATKFGVRVEGGRTFYDNRPAYMRSALDASLRRLGTDHVDLYQIHYRDGVTPLAEVAAALADEVRAGKVRAVGLSNVTAADMAEIEGCGLRFSSLQAEYSLARRDHEADVLELAEGLDVAPLTWGSLGQGVLTGKYGADASFGADDRRSRAVYVNFHGERLERNLRIVESMRGVSERTGRSLPAIAVRFILDRLPGSVALCGAKRPAQIAESAGAADWRLADEDMELLDEISKEDAR